MLGLNFDYAYTFKQFNAKPAVGAGVHALIFGAELHSRILPITIGANFNYVNSEAVQYLIPGISGSVFRTWDIFCVIELSRKKKGNWDKATLPKSMWLNGSVGLGPTVIILEKEFADDAGLSNRFIPGLAMRISLGARFRVKAAH